MKKLIAIIFVALLSLTFADTAEAANLTPNKVAFTAALSHGQITASERRVLNNSLSQIKRFKSRALRNGRIGFFERIKLNSLVRQFNQKLRVLSTNRARVRNRSRRRR